MLTARHFAENAASGPHINLFRFNRLQTALAVHIQVLPERGSRESGKELEPERNTHMKRHSKGLAVITGASTGIGAVYAHRPAHPRSDLLLAPPNHEPLP